PQLLDECLSFLTQQQRTLPYATSFRYTTLFRSSGNASVSLRNNTIGFGGATTLHEYSTMSYEGNLLMMVPQKEGSFALPEIDLTDIASLEIMAAAQEPVSGDYVFELRLDGADGKKVGEGVRKGGTGKQLGGEGPYVGPFRI